MHHDSQGSEVVDTRACVLTQPVLSCPRGTTRLAKSTACLPATISSYTGPGRESGSKFGVDEESVHVHLRSAAGP